MTSEIKIKTPSEIKIMEENGKVLSEILNQVCSRVCCGVSTYSLDLIAKRLFEKHKAFSACLNYNGFPANICISVNEEIVHGIPSKDKTINDGDIVGVDIALVKNGYFVDSARTIPVGKIDNSSKKLLEVTENALMRGIEFFYPQKTIGHYVRFVQSYIEDNGMFVFDNIVGHGIGEELHEQPHVPNCGRIGGNVILKEGMTLAIEPMVNLGTKNIRQMPDGWTLVTADGSRSAHFEHTIAITKDGPKILTL